MVIFDEEDMKWAMEVFNVGKVVYPKLKEEKDSSDHYVKDFILNQETLDAMEEAEDIASGSVITESYKTFDDMWSDICETTDK